MIVSQIDHTRKHSLIIHEALTHNRGLNWIMLRVHSKEQRHKCLEALARDMWWRDDLYHFTYYIGMPFVPGLKGESLGAHIYQLHRDLGPIEDWEVIETLVNRPFRLREIKDELRRINESGRKGSQGSQQKPPERDAHSG